MASPLERSVDEKRHTEDTVVENERLEVNVKKLTEHMADLEDALVKEQVIIADRTSKSKENNKRLDNVAYKKEGLQACLR